MPFSDALNQIIETKTQVGLKRDEHRDNVKGAFALRTFGNPELVSGSIKDKNIVLVDDVFTSGAMMSEYCRVLKKVGAANVRAMAVALG